jgi:LysR family cys regulon transcriptional activator
MVVPRDHPLAEAPRITLEQLATQPLVTYHASFTGRTRIDRAFASRGLTPEIALEAIDSDVLKTYVRLGMGVGLVAEMAMQEEPPNSELVWRPLGQLLGQNVTRVAFKRGAYLRNYVYSFAEMLSDRLSRKLIERAMSGEATDFGM